MSDNTTTTDDIEVLPIRLKTTIKNIPKKKKIKIMEIVDFNYVMEKFSNVNKAYKYILNIYNNLSESFDLELDDLELVCVLNKMYNKR